MEANSQSSVLAGPSFLSSFEREGPRPRAGRPATERLTKQFTGCVESYCLGRR